MGCLVLAALTDGPLRWSELRRTVQGVSEKMLAQTLRTLEDDGFVHREAQAVVPPRVDYWLTDRGRDDLSAHLIPLLQWIGRHAEEITDTGQPGAGQPVSSARLSRPAQRDP